ncbi:hypothetical protein [Streptomyces cinereoruber]|uniref:hypothetical protein n=1 Tax=Streptomyces cinereoruber TaxID=67260 RepID=UPI00363D9AD0
MGDVQQPEARRSGKGAATPQDSRHLKATQRTGKQPEGEGDKKGRARTGGPTPPEQRPDHP